MPKKLKIGIKKPYIAYPGSLVQQNYGESLTHGFLLWDIKTAKNFDVEFCELSNPKPYVTINWLGSVTRTLEHVKKTFKLGSRFRVYSPVQLAQHDAIALSSALRDSMQASEVTFKSDQQVSRDLIISGTTNVVKEDLRNPEVLFKLIREYHHSTKITDRELSDVSDLVKNYIVDSDVEDVVRNSKWTLRHLKFDNTFGYGESNELNFEKLNGIVGIFGPNRSGKSSIPGTIMYSLFNGTDRGSVKNLHVINSRKPHCYTRAIVNVNGTDYVIERQSVKNENKRGVFSAATHLNVFKLENGVAVDLAGEQRSDTEKVVRRLIGAAEDFLLTSLAAQDEIKMFISQGSSKRRQVLSRFLDLDIFDKMYDMAKADFNVAKGALRLLPDRDWPTLERQCWDKMTLCDEEITEKTALHNDTIEKIDQLKKQLSSHSDVTPVYVEQVDTQRIRVNTVRTTLKNSESALTICTDTLKKAEDKIAKIDHTLESYDVVALKRRLAAQRELEIAVNQLRHAYESDASVVNQHEKSLKLLDTVPCGDQFPTCKFIKDAHSSKERIEAQRRKASKSLERLSKSLKEFNESKDENLQDQIEKIELLQEKRRTCVAEVSNKRFESSKLQTLISETNLQLSSAITRLEGFELALQNTENAEVVLLRTEIDTATKLLRKIDSDKMNAATERGRVQTLIDTYHSERERRETTLEKTRAYELITTAFSRKGIPSIIIKSQLPLINSEVAKILQGIVDFSIELEADDESDSMEIYIDYGDSRRIIELCSGMEKMIASIAIRVALTNVSSLPKTDLFIIDEGFGSLDETNVEACNRLLASLKRYFKTVIVITHVEGVKDAADIVIEVSKNEKDARVCYA